MFRRPYRKILNLRINADRGLFFLNTLFVKHPSGEAQVYGAGQNADNGEDRHKAINHGEVSQLS